jgi:hypothetical protein
MLGSYSPGTRRVLAVVLAGKSEYIPVRRLVLAGVLAGKSEYIPEYSPWYSPVSQSIFRGTR